MTIWQKIRVYLENHNWFVLPHYLIMVALAILVIKTEHVIPMALIIFYAASTLIFLFLVSRKTDNWWYHEYSENEWGISRRVNQALEKLLDGMGRGKSIPPR